MRRRTALYNLSLITAGAALLPSCSDGLQLTWDNSKSLVLTPDQSTWLSSMSEAIVPNGDRTLTTFESLPDFVSKMVSFGHDKEEISTFVNGYNLCTDELKNIYESDTSELTSEQIIEYFVNQLEPEENTEEVDEQSLLNAKAKTFFARRLRALSIQHVTTSKEYQEDVLAFKMVPDSYAACTTI